MAHFQVKLGGQWKDYSSTEDRILKRAFMAGFPTARFSFRGQSYSYDFKRMVQINADTHKERRVRAPRNWRAPAKPVCPAGPTTVVNVPSGSAGSTIHVPHPRTKGAFIAVHVPRGAKPGQAMLVPVPRHSSAATHAAGTASPLVAGSAVAKKETQPDSSPWSTGGKVAAGATGVGALGVAYVGGVVLGKHIYEHGIDATVDGIGDGVEDAGEGVADFVVDAGEFAVDAGEDVGDFVMDLF
jgi:hypothetical protein